MKKKSCIKRTIPFLGLSFALSASFAQNVIVTPSPTAASVVNSIDIPAALYTGVPDINIPLFAIRGKKLSQPISLSYQASGFKVTDTGGNLGLGWSLAGGGMVTRVMRGRPDDQTDGYFSRAATVPGFQDNIPLATKTKLAENELDMLPDIFYYNTGTDGGKFVFDNQLQPRLIPQKDVRITVNNTALETFNIIAEDGTRHIYTRGDTTYVETFGGLLSYVSTWYLSKIISVDNTDSLTFNYAPIPDYDYTVAPHGFYYFFYMVPPPDQHPYVSNHSMKSDSLSNDFHAKGAKYLESIESSRQKVEFKFATTGPRKLDKVTLYTRSSTDDSLLVDKSFTFSYGWFQDTDNQLRRLRLDSITEIAGNGKSNPPYKFYYSSDRLPAPNSSAQDHWGYYNGASNTNLIPAMTVDGYTVSTNDRGVHADRVGGCMLSKIVSPLGGSTEYYFQGNTYGSSNTPGPGLRISKIVQKDPYSAINSVTNYDYADPVAGNSSGTLMDLPSYTAILNVSDNHAGPTLHYKCELINVYPTGSGTFANTPVVYQYVTTYNNDDVNATGKTVNKFSVLPGITQQYPFFPPSDNSWQLGNPAEISACKVVSGTATPVSKTVNTFSLGTYSTIVKGLRAAYNKILFGTLAPTDADFVIENCYENSIFQYVSQSVDYTYEQNSGTLNLSVGRKIYYDNSSVHLQPTRIVTSTSIPGDSLRKEITYPFDYPSTGVMGEMQALHMKSYPVETRSITKTGATEYVTGYQKTDYFQWAPSRIYPQYEYRGKLPGKVLKSTFLANPSSYLRRVQDFVAYDGGGYLIEAKREGGTPSAQMFDSQVGSKTAEALNAHYDQIAFSSFESKASGHWALTPANITNTDAKTGTRCIVLQTGAPVWATFFPAGNYTLTYFEKGGSATLLLNGGATSLGSQTIPAGPDGWTLQVKQINFTGTTSGMSLSGSNIKIDEVRLCPRDAVMSTTSYNERGQPTTATDGQMNSRYYEYDEWHRMKVVRDRNRKILEHYEYHIADN
jgi:YD repeat-containing protein